MNEPSNPQEVKGQPTDPNTRAALAEIARTTPSCIRLSDIQDGKRHVIFLIAAVLLALAGAAISEMLYAKGSPVLRQSVEGVASLFCGEPGGACDQVADSKWGGIRFNPAPNVTMRIPTALIGMVYFSLLFVWYLFIGRSNHAGRRWHLLPVLLTTVGAAVSGYLTYIMISVLQTTCSACLAIHIINFLLFAVTLVLWPGRGETDVAPVQPPAQPSGRLVLTTLVLVIAVVGNLYFGMRMGWTQGQAGIYKSLYESYAKDGELMAYAWQNEPEVEIPVTDADAVYGPADAEHTIVMFGDFHCGACRLASTMIKDEVMTLPGVSVRLVNKYLPQDTTCNAHREHTHFKGACQTAFTAEAVLQEKGEAAYWKVAEELYARQKELTPATREAIAESAGLTAGEYESAIKSAAVQDRVKACTELAHDLNVTRTPTVFLDGRRVDTWNELTTWEAIFGVNVPTTRPAAAKSQPADAEADLAEDDS